jgi:uncharacterized membrane protein HdeD (DUF308 family)
MNGFRRYRPFSLLTGAILIVLGIVFLSAPGRVAEFMAILAGAAIAAVGLLRLIVVTASWSLLVKPVMSLITGLIFLTTGILMLLNPEVTITITGAVIGIFAVLMALDRFTTAYRIKHRINILPTVISGLIHLAFGIAMIYYAFIALAAIIVLAGLYLTVAGIMSILSARVFNDF